MLVLDYNEDRSLQTSSNNNEAHKREFLSATMKLGTSAERLHGSSAKVQISTLSPYTHFGGGVYTMSAVKRMTAKSDFIKMPFMDRKCMEELYENCRTRKLLEECNCVPWEVTSY